MDEENEKSAQNSNDTDYETDEEALGNNFQHIRNHSKRPNSVTEILDFIIILNLTFSDLGIQKLFLLFRSLQNRENKMENHEIE